MIETVKKIRNVILDVVLVALGLFAIFLIGMKFTGFTSYVVLSGSMTPELNIGDLVYVKECDDIKVGDYITFYINDKKNIVTHEVIEIDTDHCYITKGIANETADINPVQENDVIGKVYFSIPYLGYVLVSSFY